MRLKFFIGLAALGLPCLGASGCTPVDPVAESNKNFTVEPSAKDPEAAAKAEVELQKKQQQLDKERAAGKGR